VSGPATLEETVMSVTTTVHINFRGDARAMRETCGSARKGMKEGVPSRMIES
jgi:hypothetical protein